jgi:hypothetical protein
MAGGKAFQDMAGAQAAAFQRNVDLKNYFPISQQWE